MAAWQSQSVLVPYDPARGAEALAGLERWRTAEGDGAPEPIGAAMGDFVAGLAGNSPFLAGVIERDPAFAHRVFSEEGAALAAEVLEGVRREGVEARDRTALMALLRRAKSRIALISATMDVAGLWPLGQVTGLLSDFADLALDLCVARLLHEAMSAGDLVWPGGEEAPPAPELAAGTGFAVLGLGKLGARELNYSSDVDLIVFYDGDADIYRGRRSLSDCFTKLTRDLMEMMQKRTAEGYVFRVDLRLRPDPGATPLAMSMTAAETYYQSVGQNWERAAMIKARTVAGDRRAGQSFLDRLRPFVWRRSLDFAAIRDIHAIKTRVHEFHEHGGIAVPGQDVKLGRGGIREVEFIAQIHQLIAGGRDVALRTPGTLETLKEIARLGHIAAADEEKLRAAYVYLRTLEHRLQMINDAQTHSIPEDPAAIEHVACFMGFENSAAFERATLAHLTAVGQIYDRLLGGWEGAEPEEGRSPEARAAQLDDLGFNRETAGPMLEQWRLGRYRALRTERARKLLEACLPDLLAAFAATSDPDRALVRFDAFLGRLPAGVQIFSLFQANHWLFKLIAGIMGNAPALADHLARRPQLLDSVLDPGFFDPLPPSEDLAAGLGGLLKLARDYEDIMELSRRWLGDMRFQVGVQVLERLADVGEAGRSYARLADITINTLVPEVTREFARKHGHFPGGDLAVIGMGSYGGRALSATSDLDIILLYDADFSVEASDGEKPLGPSQYFSRLGQHLITALTARTGEGVLYEIDMRLRPSGGAGPLVVTLKTFEDYQRESAWTWEHMALTRARIVHGGADFAARIRDSIAGTLGQKRDPGELAAKVDDMRGRLAAEFGTEDPWSLKHVRGGLVDAEFVVQYLLLRDSHAHPGLCDPDIGTAIDNLVAVGALEAGDAERLAAAHALILSVRSLLRLCHGAQRREEEFSAGLKTLLAESTGHADFEALKSGLEEARRFVYSLYSRVVETPAGGGTS